MTEDQIVEIADNAFLNCVSLEEINLPKSLERLGSYFLGFHFTTTGSFVSVLFDPYDERYLRYKCPFGGKQEIVRKKLNLIIPDEMKKNIVFRNEPSYGSLNILFYTFSDTAKYLSLATQSKIRNLGYNGEF